MYVVGVLAGLDWLFAWVLLPALRMRHWAEPTLCGRRIGPNKYVRRHGVPFCTGGLDWLYAWVVLAPLRIRHWAGLRLGWRRCVVFPFGLRRLIHNDPTNILKTSQNQA